MLNDPLRYLVNNFDSRLLFCLDTCIELFKFCDASKWLKGLFGGLFSLVINLAPSSNLRGLGMRLAYWEWESFMTSVGNHYYMRYM